MDPRRLLPALTAAACALVVAALVVTLARPGAPSRSAAPLQRAEAGGPPVGSGPGAVLAAWDERRSAAWAAGDAVALADLYAPGSRAGAADVRLLRHYRERGLRVEGLTTQVLALEVLARGPRRLVLLVTDRVAGGAAVGGADPVALPADRASTRRVVLVRGAGEGWVVAEARDQESAAASTSFTSSSSKS